VRIHNYGQTPASQMKIYFLAARNRDILYKKGGYSKESFPAVLLPNGTLGAFHDININTYIEAKNGDGLFFLKIKILYTGIDEEEYVFYSFNSYNKQGGYFDVDESYLGKVKDSEKHVR
jgi:hypothetical protein